MTTRAEEEAFDSVLRENAELHAWAEKVLRALGQMEHKKQVPGMVMEDVDLRRELIHEGHVLLGYPL